MYLSIRAQKRERRKEIEKQKRLCYNAKKKEGDFIFAETIRKILNDYKKDDIVITQQTLANCLGISRQSFSNKMKRDSFSCEEMVIIANRLRLKLVLKGKDTEYEIKKEE